MKVVLAGSRSFGAAVYGLLQELHWDVVLVTSPTQQPSGPDRLQRATWDTDVPWCDIDAFGPQDVPANTDLVVAAHCPVPLPMEAVQKARLGGIAYHPSLLPRHRGRDTVRWTVHTRDAVSGGTVHWITEVLNGGPILAQEHCFVDPSWSASDLWREQLFPLGIRLLRRALREVAAGTAPAKPQDERFATYEPAMWTGPRRIRSRHTDDQEGSLTRSKAVLDELTVAYQQYQSAQTWLAWRRLQMAIDDVVGGVEHPSIDSLPIMWPRIGDLPVLPPLPSDGFGDAPVIIPAGGRMTWQLLDSILRHYHGFRSLYEAEGIEELHVAGYVINVHDMLEGIDRLPNRQRQAVVLTCIHDMREVDAAKIMLPGSKSAAPVGTYKRKGLRKLVTWYWDLEPTEEDLADDDDELEVS